MDAGSGTSGALVMSKLMVGAMFQSDALFSEMSMTEPSVKLATIGSLLLDQSSESVEAE